MDTTQRANTDRHRYASGVNEIGCIIIPPALVVDVVHFKLDIGERISGCDRN